MSIRLIKVSKDLNVGINTLVEFLQKKDIAIEANPNTKIDNEQYELLLAEFGKDKKEKLASDKNKKAPKEKKKTEKSEIEAEIIKAAIPEEIKPQIQIIDKIDLDNLNRSKKNIIKENPITPVDEKTDIENKIILNESEVEDVTEKEAKKKPVFEEVEVYNQLEKDVTELQENEKENLEEKQVEQFTHITDSSEKEEDNETDRAVISEENNDDVFRLNNTTIKSNIVVKGTIDLSTINDKTRPTKKTKAEKKKERIDKENSDPKKLKEHTVKLLKKETVDEEKKNKIDTADDANRKKRARIKKGKVDIEKSITNTNTNPTIVNAQKNRTAKTLHRRNTASNNNSNTNNVSEEDVQKQIKETLARLTNKGTKTKGAKYRKDKREANALKYQMELEQQEEESRTIKITEFVTANDLANMMNVPVVQVISTCMSIGMMVSINQRLDAETINIVADEFGFKTEYVSAEVVEAISEEEDKEEDLTARAPIVTVMGHVDHGKTSLLDNIRQTNVIAGEAGGITQHIGAYNVKLKDGRRITFLDTPGHEAFTAMRARGAQITDIAIIIIAADDNIMPQTIEAINHASAAGVPIVFAINKIDKPAANPDKIKESLANMNYLVESWGGKYQSQDISAKSGLGVDDLLEKVLLEAELLELKANSNRRAIGSVIESSLDKGRGYVSTILVQNGTLKQGDIVLAGTYYGKIKAMFNERNVRIDQAAPSEPALILGLNGAPQAGDAFHVLETEQEAREIANKREQLQREQGLRTQKILTLDDIGRRIAIGNFQQLNVIVKGDVDGSVEALADSLINLSTEEIQVNVIHKAVGAISESDITLAAASDAIVIGFQVRPGVTARRLAEKEGVEIRLYSIIYDAIEEVKSAMEGMLSPEIKEEITANVEVRDVFKITKVGTVAGCMVKDGKIKRSNKIRLIRDGIVIYSGDLGSLKRFKDDVKEVSSGYECGLNIHNYNDIKVGDIIEAFEQIEVKKTLS